MDEDDLVTLTVPIERVRRHRLSGTRDAEHHVCVEEERDPAADRIASRGDTAGLGQMMSVRLVLADRDERHLAKELDLVCSSRRNDVVEQAAAAHESLDSEQLLGVQAAVRRPVLGMPLGRHAPAANVKHRPNASVCSGASLGGGVASDGGGQARLPSRGPLQRRRHSPRRHRGTRDEPTTATGRPSQRSHPRAGRRAGNPNDVRHPTSASSEHPSRRWRRRSRCPGRRCHALQASRHGAWSRCQWRS